MGLSCSGTLPEAPMTYLLGSEHSGSQAVSYSLQGGNNTSGFIRAF